MVILPGELHCLDGPLKATQELISHPQCVKASTGYAAHRGYKAERIIRPSPCQSVQPSFRCCLRFDVHYPDRDHLRTLFRLSTFGRGFLPAVQSVATILHANLSGENDTERLFGASGVVYVLGCVPSSHPYQKSSPRRRCV